MGLNATNDSSSFTTIMTTITSMGSPPAIKGLSGYLVYLMLRLLQCILINEGTNKKRKTQRFCLWKLAKSCYGLRGDFVSSRECS